MSHVRGDYKSEEDLICIVLGCARSLVHVPPGVHAMLSPKTNVCEEQTVILVKLKKKLYNAALGPSAVLRLKESQGGRCPSREPE